MCGIAGFYLAENTTINPHLLKSVLEKEQSRGPDAQGYYFSDQTGFGHQRLKIFDLTDNSAQPMVDNQLGLALVYNGEIYNFLDLKKELIQLGYSFTSEGDSEVLLKGYHAFGENVVHKLEGMFAFAIWEQQTKKLFLARDRLGIKPLYYSKNQKGFQFASTLPALLEFKEIDTSINKIALHYYLTFHIIPEPLTLLNGIEKLAPGSTLTVYPDGKIEKKVYWKLTLNESCTRHDLDINGWVDHSYQALYKATERQLAADVPVGLLLSGGLDSSLLLAFIKKIKDNIETFSIGFESNDKTLGNEFYYSDLMVSHFKTKHHKLMISNRKLIDSLASCVSSMSEPMMSHDNIGFYLLSKEVSNYVKVVLSGQGADELFAGYHWFQPPLENLTPQNNTDYILSKVADGSFQDYQNLVTPDYLTSNHSYELISNLCKENGSTNVIENLLVFESTYGLSSGPLSRVDNMTMSSSLEARVPFLDELVVSLALSMPLEYKLKDNGKYILKLLGQQMLPKEVINRSKGYFPVPALSHLDGELLNLMKEVLSEGSIKKHGIFNPQKIDELFKANQATPTGGSRLWQVGILEYWLQLQGL